MLENLVSTDESDLVWNWMSAEIESLRFGEYYGHCALDRELVWKIRAQDRASLTPREYSRLRDCLFDVRAPLLKGLLRLGVDWYLGELAWEHLGDLRLLSLPKFLKVAPSRFLGEFVAALERGEMPEDRQDVHFTESFRMLKGSYSPQEMRGLPVLVAANLEGPYFILEGYLRLSACLARYQSNRSERYALRVVLGRCARIDAWYLNDNSADVELAS